MDLVDRTPIYGSRVKSNEKVVMSGQTVAEALLLVRQVPTGV